LNINLNIKNERQDCKICTVCGRGITGRGKGEWRRLRWGYMVDGLHIPIQNRIIKPLAIALSGARECWLGRYDRHNVTNVQHKSNQNCHYEFPLYNEYILIIF
jgi:hypothetical protein